tara:strand:- start:1750 stop:2334 length:585 start_codon:yes stop_codon:yes gene_type:complete
MANYSLNETQTTAILDAIAIIKLQPVKDPAPFEDGLVKEPGDSAIIGDGPIAVKIPVVTATLKSVLEEIEALLITSTSEKAERYLERVSQTLNLMGLTEEAASILTVRTAVTAKNDELKDKYREVDVDLKLIEGIDILILEALIGAGFNSGLQVVRHDTKELSFLTRINESLIQKTQTHIGKMLETLGGSDRNR